MLHHGFFTIDGFTALQRVDGYPGMPVVTGSDQDRIDILPFQDLPVIPCCEQVLAVQFFGPLQPACIEIAYRRQFDAGHLEGRVHIVIAHDPHADASDTYFIVGADLLLIRDDMRPCPGSRFGFPARDESSPVESSKPVLPSCCRNLRREEGFLDMGRWFW